MDRGAWQATVHGVARVGLDLTTKPLPTDIYNSLLKTSKGALFLSPSDACQKVSLSLLHFTKTLLHEKLWVIKPYHWPQIEFLSSGGQESWHQLWLIAATFHFHWLYILHILLYMYIIYLQPPSPLPIVSFLKIKLFFWLLFFGIELHDLFVYFGK